MSLRRPPLMKTRRRKKKSLTLRRGKERRGRLPQRGHVRVQKRGRPLRRTTSLTPTRTRRSGRKGPSVRRSLKYSDTRVTHDILLFAQLSLTYEYNCAGRPGPHSTFRQAAPWIRRRWTPSLPRSPPAWRATPKRRPVEQGRRRWSWRCRKAILRTPGVKGIKPPRAPSPASCRTPCRTQLSWSTVGELLQKGVSHPIRRALPSQ